ncbi:MupG family TIM beta-alpha barrel fold protein [Enterococcus sp. DIV0876]|uniref:MupG family TIM beta-alpha barrel fold protein n=1 Tax=Enterococcus sp. DIV0876 TaxID=2774633 RepID=UPI003D2FB520
MVKMGVSVYPDKSSMKEIEEYLRLASKYGFTKVFSSMFSVDQSKKSLISEFSKFTKIAKQYGLSVTLDVNPELFEFLEVPSHDLSLFNQLGVDVLRMDIPFFDRRNIDLLNNQYGIKIEFNAMITSIMGKLLQEDIKKENLSVSFNFYPQQYTGISAHSYQEMKKIWNSAEVPVGVFISSQKKGTMGPWDVSDGLPTLEEHRHLPIDLQLRHLILMGGVDEIMIGNAFASEQEFQSISETLTILKEESIKTVKSTKLEFPYSMAKSTHKKAILSINVEEDISALENEILFDYPAHYDAGDGTEYMLRSRFPRITYKEVKIQYRPTEKEYFELGDVVIVNTNLPHYQAEVQIVLKPIRVDGQRNYLGSIATEELFLLNYINARDVFVFRTIV